MEAPSVWARPCEGAPSLRAEGRQGSIGRNSASVVSVRHRTTGRPCRSTPFGVAPHIRSEQPGEKVVIAEPARFRHDDRAVPGTRDHPADRHAGLAETLAQEVGGPANAGQQPQGPSAGDQNRPWSRPIHH